MDSVKTVILIVSKVVVLKAATRAAVDVEAVAVELVEATAATDIVVDNLSTPLCLIQKVSLLTYCLLYSEHVKQADQSWGAPTGDSEFADETAGEAIAKAEEKDEGAAGGWDSGTADIAGTTPADADGAAPAEGSAPTDATPAPIEEPEPEDNSRSYADYLAEQAEKKLKLGGGVPEARKANEGSKQKKEWENAKPMTKDEEAEYFAGKGGKERREKQRKEKNILDVDFRFAEPSTGGRGGGERGGRGGRGRGERGDFRGRGRGRGDFRGRGEGGFRGGRGGRGDGGSAPLGITDNKAFPTLGGS